MTEAQRMAAKSRCGRMCKAFETWVKRGWHKSWSVYRNQHGAYLDFDVQQAWFAFQAGWRRK